MCVQFLKKKSDFYSWGLDVQLSHYMKYRPSDSVQKIFENYVEFPQGHFMQQKRSIMWQIMQFLWRRFHIEHVLSLDSQQHWRFQRLCMMFPMLNSLKLAFYVTLLFCPAYAFFINYKISCGLCDWMRFKINCAKSHHCIISEALKILLCFGHILLEVTQSYFF